MPIKDMIAVMALKIVKVVKKYMNAVEIKQEQMQRHVFDNMNAVIEMKVKQDVN